MKWEYRYDDGAPHFMHVINQWTETRDPSWNCIIYARDCTKKEIDNLQQWFDDNIKEPSFCEFRINSGNPAFFITIYNKDDAALFKLTWG